eukprot:4814343-Ditylum_brightwellii.AAC.1
MLEYIMSGLSEDIQQCTKLLDNMGKVKAKIAIFILLLPFKLPSQPACLIQPAVRQLMSGGPFFMTPAGNLVPASYMQLRY